MKEKKIVKVAIIGCGKIAITRHIPEYNENRNCEIVGFYDFDYQKAADLVDIYGGKAFETLEALLEDKTIQAVSICTPNIFHATDSIKALKANKDVLCEKPMALSIEEADNMIQVAKENGKILMPGHNQRFVATHIKAKEILAQGIIGEILTVQTNFKHNGPEAWSVDKDKTWFFSNKLAGFGVLGDLGAHKIDLVRYLLDDEVDLMFSNLCTLDKRDAQGNLIEIEDNAMCLFKMKTGISVNLTVSWTNYGLEDNSTTIYGTLGTMKIFASELDDIVVEMNDGVSVKYHVSKMSSNTLQLNSHIIDAFIEGLLTHEELTVTSIDGRNTLLCLLAARASSETGKWVKVNYL